MFDKDLSSSISGCDLRLKGASVPINRNLTHPDMERR